MPTKPLIMRLYGTLQNGTKHDFYIYGPEGRGFESLTAYQKALDFRLKIKSFLYFLEAIQQA